MDLRHGKKDPLKSAKADGPRPNGYAGPPINVDSLGNLPFPHLKLSTPVLRNGVWPSDKSASRPARVFITIEILNGYELRCVAPTLPDSAFTRA
ncbi:hypothetical protein ABIF79_010042 [Bradyrhizobium japonicum]